MLKVISGIALRGCFMRPILNASLNSSVSAAVTKNTFHTSIKKLGGGDHEFIVCFS